jgi:uncharacterized protein
VIPASNIFNILDAMKLKNIAARRLVLHSQLLDGRTKFPKSKEGAANIIEKLGYVQIDTISVLERAHHHTLWCRQPDYKPEMLNKLLAVDRRVFEYWGHAASYLPMFDYRFYLSRMEQFENPLNNWFKEWIRKHHRHLKPVKERIRKEGPLGAKDFKLPTGQKRGPWWDWHPAKAALEILFWRGELMITERRKFQRIYDLTERVLPEHIDTRKPDDDELGRFLIGRALSSYGIAQEKEIRDHIRAGKNKIISKTLREMISSGELIEVQLEGNKSANYYAFPEAIEKASKLRKSKPTIALLSPFDNLIIQRERIKRLFDFDYILECYVPAAKRKYGYFVLPILWNDQFIGRLDPKADRKSKTLIINSLLFEENFHDFDKVLPLLAQKIYALARFNNCENIKIKTTRPGKLKIAMKSMF